HGIRDGLGVSQPVDVPSLRRRRGAKGRVPGHRYRRLERRIPPRSASARGQAAPRHACVLEMVLPLCLRDFLCPLFLQCHGAGVCGALLVFASPVVGIDGTVAYNDVATACIVFTAFYLARIWAAGESNAALLVPLGLVAGFGYAAKYTAFLAVAYAVAVVGWT